MASILVIDDELALRVPLAKVLLRAGHQVVTTSNGNEAIAIMRQAPADVVITDILMPEKEGLATIMALRREFPGVRIIAISGGGMLDPADYLSCARQFGADRTFEKPFDFNALLAVVAEFVGD